MVRYIIQLIVLGGRAVAKAFGQAVKQEYRESVSARNAAEAAGRSGTKAAKASTRTGMSLGEAKQILNVKDLEDLEAVKKSYDHLFKVNAKASGGSFYLQSKVVQAKERLELELDEEITPTTQDSDSTHNEGSDSTHKEGS